MTEAAQHPATPPDDAQAEASISTRSMRTIATASVIGTTVEWYDLFLFATASALVFNKIFFPTYDALVGTMLAFGTFAAAYVARIVGAAIFGHFGDRMGRKSMLLISLLTMGAATDERRHSRQELAGVPAGPIRTLEEVFADEDVQRRGLQLRVDHEQLGQVSVPGGPWRIDGAPVSARLPPPVLGQHTGEILERLGLGSQLPTPEDPRSIPHQDDVADVAAAEREVP